MEELPLEVEGEEEVRHQIQALAAAEEEEEVVEEAWCLMMRRRLSVGSTNGHSEVGLSSVSSSQGKSNRPLCDEETVWRCAKKDVDMKDRSRRVIGLSKSKYDEVNLKHVAVQAVDYLILSPEPHHAEQREQERASQTWR